MVDIPAHVARQYLGKLGKIDNGVVSVTSLWADEGVYYPLEIEPYTPESYFAKGKDDPDFRTKLTIALQLVQQALQERWPFRAMVADSFYGEDRGLRSGLRKLAVPYVMALKPSHDGRASRRRSRLAASGARMGGAVDHATALLASVVRAAPPPSAPALA
jgi:SRSO17 transposase